MLELGTFGELCLFQTATRSVSYRRIGELGRSMLTVGGRLYFEINRAFGEAVASMLRKQGYTNVRIRKIFPATTGT